MRDNAPVLQISILVPFHDFALPFEENQKNHWSLGQGAQEGPKVPEIFGNFKSKLCNSHWKWDRNSKIHYILL